MCELKDIVEIRSEDVHYGVNADGTTNFEDERAGSDQSDFIFYECEEHGSELYSWRLVQEHLNEHGDAV